MNRWPEDGSETGRERNEEGETYMNIKKLYFATVAFLPIPLIISEVICFWPRSQPVLPINVVSSVWTLCLIYSLIGTIVILLDLWRSTKSRDFKLLWTFLLLFFAMITQPIYWFRYIRRENL